VSSTGPELPVPLVEVAGSPMHSPEVTGPGSLIEPALGSVALLSVPTLSVASSICFGSQAATMVPRSPAVSTSLDADIIESC
jgi:hypothetical protein